MESESTSLPLLAREANTTPPPSPMPSIPDLRTLDANQLSKVPEAEVRAIEGSGQTYSDIFRRLQIRPDKYQEFYNGVVRFERNKHVAELKRGSDASLTSTSRILLRAFGYIIWAPDSQWLIDDSILSEGEVRLTYSRKLGPDHPDNARFYPILHTLWVRMRNVLFAQKPAPQPGRRRGRPALGRPSAPPPPVTDIEEEIYHTASTSHAAFERARAEASRKLTALWDKLPETDTSNRQYTYDETDKAILELILRLHEVRGHSDPRIFTSLWEERIMRINELEDITPTDDNNAQAQSASPATSAWNPMYLSNEPFNTRGAPIRSAASTIPPTLPSVMSIWISTSRLPSISLSASGLPDVTHTTAPPQLAYHWVDAPVENADMTRFIQGVNWRIEPNASDIVGFVFSYGWNDVVCFISTGRFETHEQTKYNGNGYTEGVTQQEDNDVDMEGVVMQKTVKSKGPDVDFPTHQWQVIGAGWRDFQNDLRDAARKGVKVWRMKVCVVEMPTTR